MNTPWSCFIVGAAILLGLVGCSDPAARNDPSWLRASIAGSIDTSYEGTGDFYAGADAAAGVAARFGLNSDGVGASKYESVGFLRWGAGRPRQGIYPLGPLDQSDSEARGFTALYIRRGLELTEYFAADSGQVEINSSSKDRVRGTFRFVAFRYCAINITGDAIGCGKPWEPTADAPRIEVSGSFDAAPFDSDDIELPIVERPIPKG